MPKGRRSTGLNTIIGYKLVKVPIVLVLALWLTLARERAARTVQRLAGDLADVGPFGTQLAAWLESHLSPRTVVRGAVVAWLDVAITTVEVALLLRGKAWGEWLVAGSLGVLVVLELGSLERRPSIARLVVVILNGAVVAYLVGQRLRRKRHGH